MSILAGDLGAAWAMRLLFEVALPPVRLVLAARELARVEEDVVEGQVLDVAGQSRDLREVESMHALKTASYSVRGPVVIGARLAGAGDAQIEALAAFAEPLGVAFQLRDDLLGVFGDASTMGKPAASDLRAGKRSAVVVDAMVHGVTERDLGGVLGCSGATDAAVRDAIGRLLECGTKARIEARIEALVQEANRALDRARLAATGQALLSSAIGALTHRQS